MPSEAAVQRRIRDLLYARAIESQKMIGNALQSGVPDLFCGRFWIEVKAPGKKLRPSQVEWCERFEPQGAVIYVCDDARKLWDIITEDGKCTSKAGTGRPNWREFCPRVHHRVKLKGALDAFAASR